MFFLLYCVFCSDRSELFSVNLHSPMMCENTCRVVTTLAIYSEVHGYKYNLFAHRPPIMTSTSLLTFRPFRQIKEEKLTWNWANVVSFYIFSSTHYVKDIIAVAVASQLLAKLLSKDGMTYYWVAEWGNEWMNN